ncbi:MAG: hypothetical protein U1F33_05440 [Alphaproteobacteria bacterium]
MSDGRTQDTKLEHRPAGEVRGLVRPYYIAVALIVGIGLLLAYLLLPRQRELAFIQMKSQDFQAARSAYEAQLGAGDLPPGVIAPLAEIYEYFGDIEKAIALFVRYVAKHPDNVDAWRRLAHYYLDTQNQSGRRQALEEIDRRQPSASNLRDLIAFYRIAGDYVALEPALTKLVKDYAATSDEITELAQIWASKRRYDDAAALLARFEAGEASVFDDTSALVLAALRLDLGRAEDAVSGASSYLAKHPTPESVSTLATLFRSRGYPDLALKILEPFGALADGNLTLLETLVELEHAAGLDSLAFARLDRLDSEGRLPLALYENYVDLALELGDVSRAEKFVARVKPEVVPSGAIADLVGALLNGGEIARATALAKQAGDRVFEDRPMLGAELALARGDKAEAERWVRVAETHPALSANERVALAGYWAGVGRKADARRLALALALDPQTSDEEMPSLAAVFAEIGATPSDVALFDKIKGRQSSLPLQAAWAIVASAAGRGSEVRGWLAGTLPTITNKSLLASLYFAARAGKLTPMALAVARRLYALDASPRNTVLLSEALTAVGQANEALALIRPLLPGGLDVQQAYVAALAKAYASGAPVKDELVAFATKRLEDPALTPAEKGAFANTLVEAGAYDVALPILANLARSRGGEWFFAFLDAAKKARRRDTAVAFLRSELDRTDLTRAQREERLYALIDVAGPQAALPYLEAFANSYGGDWIFAYEDALLKSGQEGRFLEFLTKQTERGDLSVVERRDAAFRLLNSGRKAAAERVFLSLARDEGPNGEDVNQLLYLWGPRPNGAAIDWLEGRARTATGSARAGWLAHLANVGANDRVVRFAEASGAANAMDDGTFKAYLDALLASRKMDKLAGALKARLPLENDLARLREMGRLAADIGLASEALTAYQRILAQKPDDREALRGAGLAALSLRRYDEARPRLERYVALGTAEPDIRYAYAEVLSALRQRDQANAEYARALKEIDAMAKPNFQLRLVRANILQRLGRGEEAVAAFEVLKAERPNDPELRADLASALLQNKSYDRAKQILTAP